MRQLPDDFIAHLEATAAAYLPHSDPIRQSGFGGGAARWLAEREPILDAVNGPGTLIVMRTAGITVVGRRTVGSIPEAQFAWTQFAWADAAPAE
jgi:hypothetical protein